MDADLDLGRGLSLASAPALFVDGEQVPFPFGVTELAQVLDSASLDKP